MCIFHIAEEKFNLSANYCSHIEEHTDDAIYGDIEKEVFFYSNLRFLNLHVKGCQF